MYANDLLVMCKVDEKEVEVVKNIWINQIFSFQKIPVTEQIEVLKRS